MDSKELPVIHALWIGRSLGVISRACLKSFLMRGHEVCLHVYGEVEDIPEGISLSDGNKIIPQANIIKHTKTGSYALFSDLFRYRLLQQMPGVYVDCDVYCLKPIVVHDTGYIFGFEEDGRINGAVLAMPQDSPLLSRLLKAAADPFFVPPWYKKTKRRHLMCKKFLGLGKNIADMPWGVIGPDALTYFANQLELASLGQPIDIFYPVHYRCISQLLDARLGVGDVTTSRTLAVHLYNERLKGVHFDSLEPGCVLQKFLQNEI